MLSEMAIVTDLPTELITIICGNLDRSRDLSAIARTCRRLFTIADPILYENACRDRQIVPLAWGAKHGMAGTVRKAIDAGADINHHFRLSMTRKHWKIVVQLEKTAIRAMGGIHSNADSRLSSGSWNSSTATPMPWPKLPLASIRRSPTSTTWPLPTDCTTTLWRRIWRTRDSMRNMAALNTAALNTADYNHLTVTRRYTALHVAAREGHAEVVKVLLEAGAYMETESQWYCSCQPPIGLWSTVENPSENLHETAEWTPLHVAMCSNHFDIAKMLIDKACDMTLKAPEEAGKFSPLHHAAAAGDMDLVKHLLETPWYDSSDIDIEDDTGLTPFYHAYANRCWDSTVPYLLELGANINMIIKLSLWNCSVKTTPLGEACRLGLFEDAIKLVDLGGDIKKGIISPLPAAEPGNHIPLLHVCCMAPRQVQMGFPEVMALQDETSGSRMKLISKLIAAGTPPNCQWEGNSGQSPLSIAAQQGILPALEALLEAGADVHARDSLGRNALMTAISEQCRPQQMPAILSRFMGTLSVETHTFSTVIERLLDAGSNINDQDNEGKTVLHLLFYNHERITLSRSSDYEDEELLRMLLSRGADPFIQDKEGTDAFRNAFRGRYYSACDILIRHKSAQIVRSLDPEALLDMFKDAASEKFVSSGEFVNPGGKRPIFVEMVLDLDSNRLLSSNKGLLLDLLGRASLYSPQLLAAECLCRRGLRDMNLTTADKVFILHRSVGIDSWSIARQILEEGAEVDSRIGAGESPLYQALMGTIDCSTRKMEFIVRLVDSGANIHLPPSKPGGKTPLAVAIAKGQTRIVEWMLKKQPIEGNPQAVAADYLHHALSLAALPGNQALALEPLHARAQRKGLPSEAIVRALLLSGADPNQANGDGDKPLAVLLAGLLERKCLVSRLYHYIKLMGKGVDIHAKNLVGVSTGRYLEMLADIVRADGNAQMAEKLLGFKRALGKQVV
ncbi:ankyrin repeat-containing domain protein, partial [Bombardia bombarda]